MYDINSMWLLFSAPAFYAHAINGVLILIAFVIFLRSYSRLSTNEVLVATLLASIAVGIHGISHVEVGGLMRSLEKNYKQ